MDLDKHRGRIMLRYDLCSFFVFYFSLMKCVHDLEFVVVFVELVGSSYFALLLSLVIFELLVVRGIDICCVWQGGIYHGLSTE